MLNKVKLLILVFFICSYGLLFSQDSKVNNSEDKYTTVNIMLTKITETKLGTILEYFVSDDLKHIYIPDDFYNKNIAVKVFENDRGISPQGNIVYKNLKPYRLKVYLPKNSSGLTYRHKDILTDEEKDKFKISELTIN